METQNFIVTEEILRDQYSRAEVCAEETKRLIAGVRSAHSNEDQFAYLQKSMAFFGLANQIYQARLHAEPRLKVPWQYEMMGIMKAMAISFGVLSARELEPFDTDDRFYDPAWIMQMADMFYVHYRRTVEKNHTTLSR